MQGMNGMVYKVNPYRAKVKISSDDQGETSLADAHIPASKESIEQNAARRRRVEEGC